MIERERRPSLIPILALLGASAWGSACNVIYWPVLPILVPAMEGRGSPFVAYWLYIWTPDSDKCLYELKYHDWYPDLFPEPPPGPLPPVDSEEFNFDD